MKFSFFLIERNVRKIDEMKIYMNFLYLIFTENNSNILYIKEKSKQV